MDGETNTVDQTETSTEASTETTTEVTVEIKGTDKPEETKADTKDPETQETETSAEEKPEDKPDTKTDSEEKPKDTTEIDKRIEEKDTEISELTDKYNQEKDNAKTFKETADRLETVIKTIVTTKLEAVPAEFKELLPEGDAVTQLEWLNKAESTGLFGKKVNPEVEIGRNLSVDKETATHKKPTSPTQRMSNAFSQSFKKK